MLKSTLTVLGGTAVAQGIGFLALPVLTRLFVPEAFGQFQLYQSALTVLLVLAAMRYEIALLSASDGREFAATLRLCIAVNVIVAFLALIGCWFVGAFDGLVSPSALSVLWYLPGGLLVGGLLQTFGYLPTRRKAFAAGSSSKMVQSLGYAGSGIAIGSIFPFPTGLVAADVIARSCAIVTLLLQRSVFDRAALVGGLWSEVVVAARKFRDFPLMSVPGGLINAAGGVMTSVLMFGHFGSSVSGQFGLVERSMTLPLGMVAVAVSQVFTAELAAGLRTGSFATQALFRGTMRRMLVIGIVPTILVAWLGPWLFAVVFGGTWSVAGEFARIMSPLVLVSLVMGSVNMALLVMGRQRIQLAWEISRLTIMGSAWTCIVVLDLAPHVAVGLHVAASIAANLLYLWLADWAIRRLAAVSPEPID